MKVMHTELEGVYLIEPEVIGDSRGWFMETYSIIKLPEVVSEFVQDNHSFSEKKGVLRGIHFQQEPYAQAKLVRCVCGSVMDFAIDLRKGSPTYKKWIGVQLSAENKKMIYIPRGFGHGFVTLTDHAEFLYKVDNYYNAKSDRTIKYDDPSIRVDWGIADPILSEKDTNAPYLEESDCNFIYHAELLTAGKSL